jgi:hypothetical protein
VRHLQSTSRRNRPLCRNSNDKSRRRRRQHKKSRTDCAGDKKKRRRGWRQRKQGALPLHHSRRHHSPVKERRRQPKGIEPLPPDHHSKYPLSGRRRKATVAAASKRCGCRMPLTLLSVSGTDFAIGGSLDGSVFLFFFFFFIPLPIRPQWSIHRFSGRRAENFFLHTNSTGKRFES